MWIPLFTLSSVVVDLIHIRNPSILSCSVPAGCQCASDFYVSKGIHRLSVFILRLIIRLIYGKTAAKNRNLMICQYPAAYIPINRSNSRRVLSPHLLSDGKPKRNQ